MDRVADVMHLHEFGPTGRRASGRRERGRFEGLAGIREALPDRGRVGDEGDESDVATAGRAREREVFGDLLHELGPSYSGGVVGTACGIGGTFTPALSQRERGRRRGTGSSGRVGDG